MKAKRLLWRGVACSFLTFILSTHLVAAVGRVVAWGWDGYGQTEGPDGMTNVMAISAGWRHNLVLKSDGTVAAWGYSEGGATNVPAGLSGVAAISASDTYNLTLQNNRTVSAWGANGTDWHVAGLSNVTAIAAGWYHWMALISDGTFETWGVGTAGYSPTNVPPGVNSGIKAIAAGLDFSIVLKSNHTVVAWGWNKWGETNVPPDLNNVIAIAAGYYHGLALKADGTVVAWGDNISGQTNVPAGLSNVVAIAAGAEHSLALKADGTVVGWGDNTYGQITIPQSLTNVIAISAGEFHSLALVSEGSLSPPGCAPAPPGLVAWWRGESNPADSLGGNDGVLINGPAFSGGEVGSAFNFSGRTDCVEIPYSPSLVPTNFSVETWVNPSSQVSDPIRQDLIFGQGYGHCQLVARTGTTGVRIVWQFGTSPYNFPEVDSTTEIPIGQFSHLAGTWDGTTLRLYINGVLNAESVPGASPVDSGCSFFIGGFYSPAPDSCGYVGQFFNGTIDEVSFYSRALADSEIQSIYNAGGAGKCAPTVTTNTCVTPPSGLVGWWPGEGNASDVIGDDNGTLEGGATFAPGRVGQGLRLDGTNAYVQIPDSVALKPANVTVEAWVWLDPNLPANNGGEQVVFKKNTWSAWFEGYSLLKETIDDGNGTYSDHFQFCVSRYGNQVAINSQTIAQRGVWYHVAATYDGNQAILYVNGVAEASATPGFALDYGTDPVFIGTTGTWAPYLNMFGGIIDEVSIYNRALSSNEIAAICNAGGAGKCPPGVAPSSRVPAIYSLHPSSGTNGAIVALAGTNFNPNAADDIVYFGPVRANVISASSNSLEVLVPVGTTFGPVAVTVDGLTASSPLNFVPTFAGGGTISSSCLSFVGNLSTPNGPGRVVTADLDGDGKPDLVVADSYAGTLSIYQNVGANGSLSSASFAPRVDLPLLPGVYSNPYTVAVADVDGDGKLDIIALNADSNVVSILRNISSPGILTSNSFAARVDLPAGDVMRSVVVGDLNGDGKPDLVTADYGDNGISIFQNLSTPGTIAFAPRVDLPVGNGSINAAIGDLDGDGIPDLAVVNSIDATVSVLRNLGAGGGITTNSFAPKVDFPGTDSSFPIALGDLDGDGRLDMVIANNGQVMSVFRNTSTLGSITSNSFAARIDYPLAGRGHTIVFGDIDGDGKPDLTVVTELNSALSLFHNASTPGFISLSNRIDFTTGYNAWGVSVGDLDGDGRPDVAFVNTYDNTLSLYQNVVPFGATNVATPPAITSFTPVSGTNGAIVTITGNNFSSILASNIVYFGAVQATVLSASATMLTVSVPPGATFAPITVTVNGLIAWSSTPFEPTFSGNGSNVTVGSFAPGFNLNSGDGPGSAVIADLDGDGKPDLAEVNGNGHSVSLFRNLSTGGTLSATSFAARVDLPLPVGSNGGNPYRLRAVDLDGDEKLDLIVCEVGGSRVSIFRNIAAPGSLDTNSFEAPVSLNAGNDCRFATAADLDGDGRADIVALNFGDSTISIFKNIGSSGGITANSFAPPFTLASPGGPYELAIGDLDGDGKPDLAVANYSASVISVFRNVAAAETLNSNSFAPRVDFPSQIHGHTIVIGDMDGDGRPDLVAGFVEPQIVSVYRNLSSPGSFDTNSLAPAVDFSTPGWMHTVTLADFNGDGKPDICVVGELPSYMSIFQNQSSPGSFTTASLAPRVDFGTGWNAWGVAAGDLDGDGRPDIAFCNYYDSTLTFYQNLAPLGPATPNAPPVITRFAPSSGANGTLVTITGNNFNSILASNIVYFGAVRANVLSASATSLTVSVPVGAIYSPITVTTGGRTAWSGAPFMPTFEGRAEGNIALAPRLDLPAVDGPGAVVFADLDGDGKPDLLLNTGNHFISIYQNISTNGMITAASFAPRVDLALASGAENQMTVADVDSDGKLDIVFLDRDANQVTILGNHPTPGILTSSSFAAPVSLPTGSDPRGLVVRDLDGDGYPDIAVANWGNATVSVYRNLGTPGELSTNSFAAAVNLPVGPNPQNMAAADLDGDGLPDLVTANNNYGTSDSVSLLRNLSTPGIISFAPEIALPGLPTCYWLAVGDLDGDGKLDIAVSSFDQGQSVSVYRNLSTAGNLAFAPNVDFPAGGWGNGVALGDLDGDGRPDVVVVTQLPDHLSVFRNLSTPGSFTTNSLAPRADYPTGWNPNGIAIGDLDGDGRPDLAFAITYGATLSIYQDVTPFGGPLQISTIADQQIDYNTTTGPLAFTVSGPSTGDTFFVNAISSNTNLVPNEQVLLAGSGANWTVTVTPDSNQLGATLITLTATNLGGASNQISFTVTVTNAQPQISSIASVHVPLNTPAGPLAFTVSDLETPADQLVVTASSSNTNVVPNDQIVLGGSGTNRTVTVTPASDQVGAATITLTVTDALGGLGTTSFAFTVDQFTQIAPGLPPLTYSAVAWGDYDNDGRLDLLVTGTTNGAASGAITRVYHNDGGLFTNFISLPGVYRSAVAWNDYDRDGRLDFAVSGLTSSNQPITRIYRNNGDGTFTDIKAGLTGVFSGTLAWGDFNNDGAPDLFLSGIGGTNSSPAANLTTNLSRLYRNDGSGVFTDVNANLPAPSLGSAVWADFNNDGRLDLLLVGSSNNITGIAGIYRNLGNGSFSNVFNFTGATYYGGAAACADLDNDSLLDVAISANLGSTYIYRNNFNGTFTLRASYGGGGNSVRVAWGDINNDGYPDLLVGNTIGSHLYRNNGDGTFTDTQAPLPALANGSLALGDFDNDGDLDLLFASSVTTICRNNIGVSNTPPASLLGLVSETGLTNSVVLRWQPGKDAQSSSNGVTYNLYVGTSPGGVDVVPPLADPTNGTRRVVATGNIGPTNRALLVNLPKGIYYWNVQAIDAAYAGSPFAVHAAAPYYSFTITNSRPAISDIPNITIAPGTNAPGPVLPFTIGGAETVASRLLISVRSSNTNVVSTKDIIIVRGVPSQNYPSNCTVRVAARTNGTSVITITVTDAQGAFASDDFTVRAEQFTLVSTNFVQVQNSLIAWGDYNNDGRLDVLIAGATNGYLGTPFPPIMQPITRLYRNDGNGVFTPVPSGLPNVTRGAAAWGDFNNDGYLDLILTGTTNNAYTGAISRIYRNNGDGTFTDIGAGLPGVYNGAVEWADLDNDGRLDLLLTGTTNNSFSGAITRIYHNNGDGSFSNSVSLVGVYLSGVACADFDGDGDLDIVLTGMNNLGAAVTSVYRNNGDGTFAQAASLTGVYNASVAVGDFDNDGRPDILLAGAAGSAATTAVYHNNGNFMFSNISAGLPGARLASAAWGDFDNDGRLDILLSGTFSPYLPAGAGAFTRIYRNTGLSAALTFTNYPVSLPTNYSGTVTWADFDNNGTLDILLAGTDGVVDRLQASRSQTLLFRNNSNVTNTPPTAPTNLAATRTNNIVALTWAKSFDAQTQTILVKGQLTNYDGIKYQVRVGTMPGDIDIESPGSDLSTGFRRIVQIGDASTNRWYFTNLPPGNYFWSVQAIDNSFAGSPFAEEASFVVLHPPVAVADAFSTASNAPVSFAAAKLTLNDVDLDGFPLTVVGVSATSTSGGAVALTSGQVTYTPPLDFSGNDSFTYIISDGQGDTAVGVVIVTVSSGGPIGLNIVFGPAVISGDFIVSFAGIPGLTYTIEAAPTVSGPWAKVANLAAPTTDGGQGIGVFSFTEPVDGNATRFYRTVYPAY